MINYHKPSIFGNYMVQSGCTFRFSNSEAGEEITFSTWNNTPQTARSLQELSLATNIAPDNFQFLQQVHGDTIVHIQSVVTPPPADALITQTPGIALCALTADCAPILLYDTKEHACAAIHSGWKGTKVQIVPKTILAMQQQFGSDSKHIVAYIGACAHSEQYEVGDEFLDYFPAECIGKTQNGKYYFNNLACIFQQLQEIGVPAANIDQNSDCTLQHENYHSYRKKSEKAGRMVSFIALNHVN